MQLPNLRRDTLKSSTQRLLRTLRIWLMKSFLSSSTLILLLSNTCNCMRSMRHAITLTNQHLKMERFYLVLRLKSTSNLDLTSRILLNMIHWKIVLSKDWPVEWLRLNSNLWTRMSNGTNLPLIWEWSQILWLVSKVSILPSTYWIAVKWCKTLWMLMVIKDTWCLWARLQLDQSPSL